jgi:hypothetical protein
LSATRAGTLVPYRAAIADRVSPDRTTYVRRATGAGAAPADPGRRITCPTRMMFTSAMRFATATADTVVFQKEAMRDKVSPLRTVHVSPVEDGGGTGAGIGVGAGATCPIVTDWSEYAPMVAFRSTFPGMPGTVPLLVCW